MLWIITHNLQKEDTLKYERENSLHYANNSHGRCECFIWFSASLFFSFHPYSDSFNLFHTLFQQSKYLGPFFCFPPINDRCSGKYLGGIYKIDGNCFCESWLINVKTVSRLFVLLITQIINFLSYDQMAEPQQLFRSRLIHRWFCRIFCILAS